LSRAFPQAVVKIAASRREAQQPPPRMMAQGGDDLDSSNGRKRPEVDRGVAKQAVELDQDELGESDVLAFLDRVQERARRLVPRRVRLEGVKQDVRVKREHSGSPVRAPPRERSSGRAP